VSRDLSPLTRLLLWDYERASLPYALLVLLMLLFLVLVPPSFLADPLVMGP
jgi:hypothetical protein